MNGGKVRSEMVRASAITRFPDLGNIRALLRTPWTSVEVQSGQVRLASAVYPDAWSVSSLLVHAATDVLIYAQGADESGGEEFRLRFGNAAEEWCSTQLRLSRPSFARISQWPETIALPPQFSITGPAEAEIGLGVPITAGSADQEQLVPILWCCFSSDDKRLIVYADSEFPLDVGLVQTDAFDQIRSALKAASIIKL